MTPRPIFFAWTKSFWLGLFPALLTTLDVLFTLFGDPTTSAPVAALISQIASGFGLSINPDIVNRTMLNLAPLYALIISQQRSHAARPYTMNPKAID